MTKDRYRFIHLSDIHFGQEKNGSLVIHNDAREKLIEDCKEFARANGPADGILVAGDIAYSGKREEYDTAAEWLRRVAQAGGCEEYSVLTIPGNHDIDCKRINIYGRDAHLTIRNASPSQIDGKLNDYLDIDETGNALLPKIAAYREFASRFDCDLPSLKQPCWSREYRIGAQCIIRFLGMNSVQVSDLDDSRGNMILGNNQYIIREEPNVAPIALIHHPLSWFADESKAKTYLHRAPVILFGHEHVQGFERVENQLGQVQLHVYSGAVNPPEGSHEFPFRYNWLEFRLAGEPNSRSLSLSLWPKVWSYQKTRYILDREGLGERPFHEFEVPCPQFTPETETLPPAVQESGSARISIVAPPTLQRTEVIMEEHDPDFERLKYYFWTYLDWQERLKVLVGLDCLPKMPSQPMPQTLEHLALRTAQQKHRLSELWDQTMALVPPDQQLANPYKQNEGHHA